MESKAYWCALVEALTEEHSIPIEQSSRLKEAVEGAEWACQFNCRLTPAEFGDFESLSFLRMFSASDGNSAE